ncbi:MAG: creatininase family protein [Rhodospirillales bacterium]|nr:creatininase family protein [Rhodospirillales bacterium]
MPDIEWANLKAHELRALAAADAVVIVPVGSIEQHGPHLPVQVDTLLAGEVARGAARLVSGNGAPIVVTPVIWTGLAEHHMSFGGTITLDFETFFALIRCVVRSVARHGFKRILLLNGHGGNTTALNVIVGELTLELKLPIVTATYWLLAKEAFGKILEAQANVRHACEAETSMLLALKGELVDTDVLAEARGPTMPELSEFVSDGAYRWRQFASRTHTGVIGEPATASAEKGKKLLAAAAESVADLVTTRELWSLPI